MEHAEQIIICSKCGGSGNESVVNMSMDCEHAAKHPRPKIQNFPKSLMCHECFLRTTEEYSDQCPSFCSVCDNLIIPTGRNVANPLTGNMMHSDCVSIEELENLQQQSDNRDEAVRELEESFEGQLYKEG